MYSCYISIVWVVLVTLRAFGDASIQTGFSPRFFYVLFLTAKGLFASKQFYFMKNAITVKTSLLFLAIVSTFAVTFFFKLSIERAEKKALEIDWIIDKTYPNENCVQYALIATKDGWFPCYNCGVAETIYLKEGEVWKYGKTCLGEIGRYKNQLPYSNLVFEIEFEGSEKQCLIMEKEKIYNYPNLPECQKRSFILLRPAGNKIDR